MGCCHSNKTEDKILVDLNIFKLFRCENGDYYTTINDMIVYTLISKKINENCIVFTITFGNSDFMTITFKNNNSVKINCDTYYHDKSNNICDTILNYNIIFNDENKWSQYLDEMNNFNYWQDKIHKQKYEKIYNIILNNNKIL